MWYTSATVSAVQGENAANCIVQRFFALSAKKSFQNNGGNSRKNAGNSRNNSGNSRRPIAQNSLIFFGFFFAKNAQTQKKS